MKKLVFSLSAIILLFGPPLKADRQDEDTKYHEQNADRINHQEDEAYLAAKPAGQYILYFTDGGSVSLNLKGHLGKLQLRWVDIQTGNWGGRTTILGGKAVTINAPDKGPWVAAIVGQ